MSKLPIFVVTHPRSCSTAFERVFMTRQDLRCQHEPFGDAYYYGPEFLGSRYANAEASRQASGFKSSTYKTVVEGIEAEAAEGARIFIKDMAYYLMKPGGGPSKIAPSLLERGESWADADAKTASKHAPQLPNPTVLPWEFLSGFKFAFLIRHPSRSIPSFYRCTRPPLDEMTGWNEFMTSEAGYHELRAFFNYVCGLNGLDTKLASSSNTEITGHQKEEPSAENWRQEVKRKICVIDADDLLDHPSDVVQAFCNRVDLDFRPQMLQWDTVKDQERAEKAFEKWKGWHEDALRSKGLTARTHAKPQRTKEEENLEWLERFGPEGLQIIRAAVDENVQDYEYLKQFAWDPRKDAI